MGRLGLLITAGAAFVSKGWFQKGKHLAFAEPKPDTNVYTYDFNWDGNHGKGAPPQYQQLYLFITPCQYSKDKKQFTFIGREQMRKLSSHVNILSQKFFHMTPSRIITSFDGDAELTALGLHHAISDKFSHKALLQQDEYLRECVPFVADPSNECLVARFDENGETHDTYKLDEAFKAHFTRPMPTSEDNRKKCFKLKENFIHRDLVVVVVGGKVMRYLMARLLQLPECTWNRFSVTNASVTCVSVNGNGEAVLRWYADHNYLHPELITKLPNQW